MLGRRSLRPYCSRMPLEWEELAIDSRDPTTIGKWWGEALRVEAEEDEDGDVRIRLGSGSAPTILFIRVPEAKTVKNRLHLDFRPDDRDAEVERLLALGATRANVGQGDESWVVLADPEGNEFCVLSSRR